MKNWLTHIFSTNELERLLYRAAKAKKSKFLVFWNRGLGDIALGMYALVYRIRQHIPNSEITFVTRDDLVDGFQLLGNVGSFGHPKIKRGEKITFKQLFAQDPGKLDSYDVVMESPNPTKWLGWQIGKLVPRLTWNAEWDNLWKKFPFETDKLIGVHVHSETTYGYEKNWSFANWEMLFRKLTERGYKVVLFGFKKVPEFAIEGVYDYRGETSLLEMLSIIKNCCGVLVAPDSGVLSLTYYLDVSFPIKIVSLWADPRQGVLKQNVASPNTGLQHVPICAPEENIANISVEQVLEKIF